MQQETVNSRNTTGDEKKRRVETWLTDGQYTWLRALAIREDRSRSAILRLALRGYIQQVVDEIEEARRKAIAPTGGQPG